MQKEISIIVATKNRFHILEEAALKNMHAIKHLNCEYIIVNDGEDINLTETLKDVIILNNREQGVSKARNLGAKEAKGEILFFIDDDMWITPETIIAIKQANLNDNVVLMNWEYPPELQDAMKSRKLGRYILKSNYHTLEGRAHLKINYQEPLVPINGIGSGSFVIRKKIFETIGGYNENILFQGEDIDISNRLKQHTIGIYLFTKMTCFHNQKDRLDIAGFLLRLQQGYESQVKAGITDFVTYKFKIYQLLLPFTSIFKIIYEAIPNFSFFDLLSFRLIGMLSSLTYTKAIVNHKKMLLSDG